MPRTKDGAPDQNDENARPLPRRTEDLALPDRFQQDIDLVNCAGMAASYLQEAGARWDGLAALNGLLDVIFERLQERSDELLAERQKAAGRSAS